MKKFQQYISFYTRKNFFIIFIIVVSFLLIGLFTQCGNILPDFLNNFLNPLFGMLSVLIGIGLTIIVVKKEWEDSLDQELIVHFRYENEYIYSSYGANLLPNVDMRALAQQIGAQMAKRRDLEFIPSIKLLNKDVISVKDKCLKRKWIKYFEIEVTLLKEVGDGSYTIWNINHNEIKSVKFKERGTKFTEHINLSIMNMLSYDIENFNKFKSIKGTYNSDINAEKKLYITNAAILTSSGNFKYNIINLNEAKNLLKDTNFISAIGHQSTANILSSLLDTNIEFNRISINQEVGDKCLVFRLNGRLEEGIVYSEHEINEIGYEFGILEKII